MPLPEAAPAQAANRRRNARAAVGRARRWAPARDALWALLDAHVARGAAVAIVGAGHGDDLPLGRLSRRAGCVDLLDVDVAAARAARRRLLGRRGRVRALESDITAGAADRVAAAVIAAAPPRC